MQTAKSLAEAVGAKLEGDGAIELRGVAAPERAGPHDLIYLEKAKHADRAAASAALCVIAPESIDLKGKTILRSVQPKLAFAKAAALIIERVPIAIGIHPTAIVAPLAKVSASAADRPVCRDWRRRAHRRRHANRRAQRDRGGLLDWRPLPHSSARNSLRRRSHRTSRGNSFRRGHRRGRLRLRARGRPLLEISASGHRGNR